MDKIFDTPITTLLSKINDDMINQLYSHTLSHFTYTIPNILLTIPNPDPTTFPKFSEDSLKEVLFDECVDFLQTITGDSSPISNHPTLSKVLEKRVNACVTKSIYSTRKKMDGVPWTRWVWQDKLSSTLSSDLVKLYIIGLINRGDILNDFSLDY